MYRIRTVCRNPACQAVFGVEFAETGPLEGKTPEIAIKLSRGLRSERSTLYQATKLGKGVQIPLFIECPKCNSIFPMSELTFFAYNANATQSPH